MAIQITTKTPPTDPERRARWLLNWAGPSGASKLASDRYVVEEQRGDETKALWWLAVLTAVVAIREGAL